MNRLRLRQVLSNHWPLAATLAIYLVLAATHNLIAPLTVGNDEYAHFLYARFIAEHGRLPESRAERDNQVEVGTKADDPPLYYLIVAAAASGLEPSHLLRPVNGLPRRQLADNVVASYAFLVHTGPELWPYRGEVLLWHLGRGVSSLFGAVVVGLTYMISLALWPSRRRALTAAALVAFIPAFVFHTSVMSYDSLGAALTALFLWAAIKAILQPDRWRWWLILGLLSGLAITTKYTSVLLPLEIAGAAWLARRGRPWSWWWQRLLAAGLALLLAVSWWFGFTIWHFNTIAANGPVIGILEPLMVRGGHDSTAIRATAWLLGREVVSQAEPPPARERDYPRLGQALLDSFWAGPIAERYLLSPWLSLLVTLGAAGLAGVGLRRSRSPAGRSWLPLLGMHAFLVVPLMIIRLFLSFDPLEAVQGRHLLLPGAPAIALLLVWGWEAWGARAGRAIIAGLLGWTVGWQLGWTAVAYPPPLPVWAQQDAPEMARPVSEVPLAAMRFLAMDWQQPAGVPGLKVTLWWHGQALMVEDYLVELALLDKAERVASYTLGHPVEGRYPTRAWEPGDVVKDVHWLPLNETPAGDYRLRVRLLTRALELAPGSQPLWLGEVNVTAPAGRFDPCEPWSGGSSHPARPLAPAYRLRSTFTVIGPDRPLLQAPGGGADRAPLVSLNNLHVFIVEPDWPASYQLGVAGRNCGSLSFDLPARTYTMPAIASPLSLNFNDEVELLGYELPTRRVGPGERLPLTLYWRARRYLGEDYRVFDNLLDPEQRRWGGYDRRPRDGYSTLLWAPGEIVVDAFGVPVDPAAPDGIYTLDVGLYREAAAGAVSLPLVQDGRPSGQTSLRLGPVKVGGPPPGVTVSRPSPQVNLDQTLGEQITLLGYDRAGPTSTAGDPAGEPATLTLTFYWRADRVPAADYTVFVHLRDAANETVAQQDSPPAGGRYPTSLWEAGEIIGDTHSLPLAGLPPGRYTPVVGLYNLASGERLAVPDSPANEITLEPMDIP